MPMGVPISPMSGAAIAEMSSRIVQNQMDPTHARPRKTRKLLLLEQTLPQSSGEEQVLRWSGQ